MENKPSEKQIGFAKSLGIENPEKYDKKTLSGMIEANMRSTEGFDTPKPKEKVYESESFPVDKTTTMYVSYAKDIFLGLLANKPDNPEVIMTVAIKLVKQAREAFS